MTACLFVNVNHLGINRVSKTGSLLALFGLFEPESRVKVLGAQNLAVALGPLPNSLCCNVDCGEVLNCCI